jgi:hypothetical protein
VLPARAAFSHNGQPAVAFGVEDANNPADSEAFATPAARRTGPRAVPGAEEVLDLAFDGRRLELLTGAAPGGATCCASARVQPLTGRSQTIVTGLSGAAAGRLLALPGGRLLAAIATAEGVWVAQSSGGARFATTHRLTASGTAPESLAVASSSHAATAVAWTEGAARGIILARGSANQAPRGNRSVLSVAPGHQIAELGLAPGPTAAWIESWFDRAGAYHSQVAVAEITPRPRARQFPIPGRLASGLSLAGDARGDQVIAWSACDPLGACTVRAATRTAGKRFGSPAMLGAIDPGQAPAAAIAPSGKALVGWIAGGSVLAAAHTRTARRFGPPHVVSATSYAADLTIAFGPHEAALAAWTQGTLAPSVMAATLPAG